MNLRRTPPPSFTQPSQSSPPQGQSSHHQQRSTTSPSLLPQKASASSSASTTRRSPAASPISQTAQSLPSLRDHLHPYLPPVTPQERESGAPGSAAPTPSTAPSVFAGGYPFQPYGSTTSVASHHPPYHTLPSQPGVGYPYSHPPPPPPPLHHASGAGYPYSHPPPQPYTTTARGDDSEEDEMMAGTSSGRHRAFSTSGQSRGALGPDREAYERERGDERGSGSGDLDLEGPPKKKRRRQALSCTECKRRKIKCDRSQPCAPCTRRGEQSKCQWHIVEPVEKYIPRHEFDELKSRVEYLESLVLRGAQGYSAYPNPPHAPSSGYPAHQPSPAQSQSYPPPHPPHPPPPSAPQPQMQPHTAIPGVPGPAPSPAPPPTSGIHQLLSGAPPSPGQPRSPVLRLPRDLERERELRHARSSPVVGHAIPRERKETTSISPLPPTSTDPLSIPRRSSGHQHSLSSSSISSSSQGRGGSKGSPSLITPTSKGRRRSGSPR